MTETTTATIILETPDHAYDVYTFYDAEVCEFGDFDETSLTGFDQLTYIETLDEAPLAWAYPDPSGRWIFDEGEADRIAAEDSGRIVWVQPMREKDEPGGQDYVAAYSLVRSDQGPEGRLAHLAALQGDVRDRIEATVAELRRDGWPWSRIAELLGMSRQAAHERYRHVG